MALPFNQESWIWYTCAAAMIGARLISRTILFRSIKGLQYDDWIMGVFVTASFTVMIVLSNKWLKAQSNLVPPGFNFSTLTAEELSRRRYGSKIVVVVTHIAVIWSCKACLLTMYHRLTRTALRNENVAIKILSVYVALGFVVMEILYFAAWCRPFSEYYAVPTSSSQCNAMVHHRITKAVFNLSSDIIMLCIALQMLVRSMLPITRKLILCGIFSLGIFVIAASILKSYYSFQDPYRPSWIFWYVRESSMAILVANIPFTWTILRKLFELDDFDESNPPPWTYHSSRTAAGRRTAQSLHLNGTSGARAGKHHLPANRDDSKGMQSTTLVDSIPAVKDHASSATNDPQSDSTEAIQPHDFAHVTSPSVDDEVINSNLADGIFGTIPLRSISRDGAHLRDHVICPPPRITEDGAGGFNVNNRPTSPPPPSLAYFATPTNRLCELSVSSEGTAPMSLTPYRTSSFVDGKGRPGSASSIAGTTTVTAGGGMSARDRRARAGTSQ